MSQAGSRRPGAPLSLEKKIFFWAVGISIVLHILLIWWSQLIQLSFHPPSATPPALHPFKIHRTEIDPKMLEPAAATPPPEQRDVELNADRMEPFGQPLELPSPPAPAMSSPDTVPLSSAISDTSMQTLSALAQENSGNIPQLAQSLSREANTAALQEATEALKPGTILTDQNGNEGGSPTLPKFDDLSSLINLHGSGALRRPSFQPILLRLSSDVLFAFDSSQILPTALPILKRVAQLLADAKESHMTIEGHTDTIGEAAYNQKLSERRAQAVADWLAKQPSLSTVKFSVRGWGEERPIVNPHSNSAQQKLNRRVEIRVSAQK